MPRSPCRYTYRQRRRALFQEMSRCIVPDKLLPHVTSVLPSASSACFFLHNNPHMLVAAGTSVAMELVPVLGTWVSRTTPTSAFVQRSVPFQS